MSFLRTVSIANRHPRLRVNRRAVARMIQILDAEFRILPGDLPHLARAGLKSEIRNPKSAIPAGELSVAFLTDAALAQLHGRFLDDPTTTDVITFEGDPAQGLAGEICVSVDTAAAYAEKHRRDFARELALYVIHGWLHLVGYDDLQPSKKRVMRRAETRALRLLEDLPEAKAWCRFVCLPTP